MHACVPHTHTWGWRGVVWCALLQELTFTWPREAAYLAERNALSARVQGVMEAVGLAHVPLNVSPLALSGGQQRRLALAIQLVRCGCGWGWEWEWEWKGAQRWQGNGF